MSPPAVALDVDWPAVETSLRAEGYAVTAPVLSPAVCDRLVAGYDDPRSRFRSTVDMARHNFGRGQYKYFDYPLPDPVQALREAFYTGLAPIANAWGELLGEDPRWPDTLAELIRRCRDNGQPRPTPLLLRYGERDFNCLHQDVYGPIHFPLQVVVLLSEPGADFDGGELVLVEQRPRMQSRPIVIRLQKGAAAIIPGRHRPRPGARGHHRANVRHGVSEIVSGSRYTLGLIFHDAA